ASRPTADRGGAPEGVPDAVIPDGIGLPGVGARLRAVSWGPVRRAVPRWCGAVRATADLTGRRAHFPSSPRKRARRGGATGPVLPLSPGHPLFFALLFSRSARSTARPPRRADPQRTATSGASLRAS